MELLLVLPDGSKSLIPAAWTDLAAADVQAAVGEEGAQMLGSVTDLLAACSLVAALPGAGPKEQAARPSLEGLPNATGIFR